MDKTPSMDGAFAHSTDHPPNSPMDTLDTSQFTAVIKNADLPLLAAPQQTSADGIGCSSTSSLQLTEKTAPVDSGPSLPEQNTNTLIHGDTEPTSPACMDQTSAHSSSIQARNNVTDALNIAIIKNANLPPATLHQPGSPSSLQLSDRLDSGSLLPSIPVQPEHASPALNQTTAMDDMASIQQHGPPSPPPVLDEVATTTDDMPSSSIQGSDNPANTIEKSKCIGPYASAIGLTKDHFAVPIRDGVFPDVTVIKNGLILELYEYLTKKLNYSDYSVVNVLCKLSVDEGVLDEAALNVAVKRVWQKRVKLVRNKKGDARAAALKELQDGEFKLVRNKRFCKSPDTPRKKKLKLELRAEKVEHRKSKRKLAAAECSMVNANQKIMENKGIEEELQKERNAKKKALDDLAHLQEESDDVKTRLNDTLIDYEDVVSQLNDLNSNFNPMKDDLDSYKKRYEELGERMTALQEKYDKANTKLGQLNTRNVNKRIARREEKNVRLEKDNVELNQVLNNLKEELKDNQAKLKQSEREQTKLKDRLAVKTMRKTQSHKQNWKLAQKHKRGDIFTSDVDMLYTEHDLADLETRIEMLYQQNKELQEILALMQHEDIITFQDGKYTDDVRETIMALLSMNVATSKVTEVIRVVLQKLAKKSVQRLPSTGLITGIRLEARHLADVEVGLAMRANRPEDALGNCIHGDGTTKYHKKYQNFQVTLPDGSSRSMGLMQMEAADTQAVFDAYQTKIKELAAAIVSVDGHPDDIERTHQELLGTIKSSMTDMGPTMPQLGERLRILRKELLPKITNNWDNLSEDVKEGMVGFGQFYCKMHPLINFAEEANRVLKSFEDISTNGKNVHTLLTAEAGVTRLVRTASKAFHHRGCDKSGVEDAFTNYLEFEYNTTNHLVNYVGNRANILFEGSAAAYFHLDHMINFVSHLPDPNNLLLAVSEDASEKIHRAELRALGIIYMCVTKPLWAKTQSAKNILSMNGPLHYLQSRLIEWKEDAAPLMRGQMGVERAELETNEITESLFADSGDVELHAMTQQALELLCCAVLLILERQCKDQLPGGKYWDPSPAVQERFANVPTTNVVGERDFACLDLLVRQMPNARTITLETIIMWANNKTSAWLDGLDPTTKAAYMEAARAHAPNILQRYRERMLEIKKYRWEKLQQKQKEKAAKEAKQLAARIKLTNEVAVQGGVWCTEVTVNEKYREICETQTDEEVRRSIYSQLCFHQKVLKSKSPRKDLFQLTATVDGKIKKYTKAEMKQNLIKVVQANNLPANSEDVEIPKAPPPPVTYIDKETRQERYNEVKQKFCQRIDDERKKRAVQHSKLYLGRLIINPKLLVNVRVVHMCIDPHDIPRWFNGKVKDVTPIQSDDAALIVRNTEFEIHYEESQLEEGEPVIEMFPLLVDLKKGDLIIEDAL